MTTYKHKGYDVIDSKSAKVGATRAFGVELEVSCADWCIVDGDTCFGVKSDGSVNGDALEFVSPVLAGDAGFEAVENLCAKAEAAGWDCDRSCGYHLHIDARDLSNHQKHRVYYAYRLTEDLWAKFVSSRRMGGDYSERINRPAADIRRDGWYACCDYVRDGAGRYVWVNILSNHDTIEIRLHQGTIVKAAVCNWIKAHLRFVDVVRGLTLDQIDAAFKDKAIAGQMLEIERIWRDAGLSQYYRRRANRLRQAVHA